MAAEAPPYQPPVGGDGNAIFGFLAGRYDLEVIDIYQQPAEATARQIIAAPTLVKELPLPLKRLIGNLSDREKMIISLNLCKKPGVIERSAKQ